MRTRWVALVLLSSCARPAENKSQPRPDLVLRDARVRSWNEKGLELDARAPTVAVMKQAKTLEASDAGVLLVRAGAAVQAKVLSGDLDGSHFVAPAGAALTTSTGLNGTAPEAAYHRVADGGTFEGHHGVALSQPDSGFTLEAQGFVFDTARRSANFEQVKTSAGADRGEPGPYSEPTGRRPKEAGAER
ncbi:MAG: hypothetical protein QM723_15530 [Myxococcaceae bacterium]